MKIEKGKKYKCVKSDSYFFTENKIYYSNRSGFIIDNEGDQIRPVESKFELVEEPSTEELLKRIEALERKVKQQHASKVANACVNFAKGISESIDKQPCETVAKFKRIADHAQAITNEIASPREK